MANISRALTPENLLHEKKGAIAYVTVNRPKVLNALNMATWMDLRTAFEDARDDTAVAGVILTGAGDKAFIAGADISELASATAVEAEKFSRFAQDVLDLIENIGKPVIAAVNGFALGGGGGTQCMLRLVGKGRALQLILTGEVINALEAYRIGLVNEVVPAVDLITRSEAILQQIFSNAPVAVRFSLESVNRGLDTSQAVGLSLEASLFGLCAGTEDKKEGTRAFLEKRAPQFLGR